MKTINCLLIDPTNKTLEPYILASEAIANVIGCQWIEGVRVNNTNMCYVDEEGLLSPSPGPFFSLNGGATIIHGKGLVVGVNEEGDNVDCSISRDALWARLTWPNVKFVGFVESNEVQDHPLFGRVNVFSRKAKFEPLSKTEGKIP